MDDRFEDVEIAAFVISVIALLVALWAVWSVRVAAGGTSHGADAAAVDPTANAEPVPTAASTAARTATTTQPALEANFVFENLSAHRYALRNHGSATAYSVRLDTGEVGVHEGSTTIDEFPPGHVEEYLLIQPLQGPVSEIVVSWYTQRDGVDEAHVTQLPLNPPAEINDPAPEV